MAEEFRVLRPFEFHRQLLSKGRRADARALDEFRGIKVETDAIKTADASSLVKLGNTSLVCGCTAQIVDRKKCNDENDDMINIRVELPPICSSPTGNKTQNTAHILTKAIKNIIDETKCIDLTSLLIKDSSSHWSISIEIICLNYDGSLLDASLVAVMAALNSLKLKCDVRNLQNMTVPLRCIPVCSSFALIGDHVISDPNLEEENIAQSIFHITAAVADENLCHIIKVGGKAIDIIKLKKCIELARKRSEDL